MAQQRRGLGRGLGALIPDATRPGAGSPAGASSTAPLGSSGMDGHGDGAAETALRPVAGAYFEEVAVDSITPNPRQPRRTFDDDALDELAASITEVGLLQPVVVRSLGGSRYELIMGERRWRASQR
ncbi:MAG TPA: ParB N-terminal domain-containing protein, partial [Trebonia sp.]|nr:ParB N-terminal domain-containing protein [Trebonia sp.]